MDAPATTSADNGTSGGGDGWFTPRKQPASAAGSEQETTEGSRLAGLRPVGRATAADDAAGPVGAQADAEHRITPPGPMPTPAHGIPAYAESRTPDAPAPGIAAYAEPTPAAPVTTVLPILVPSPASAVPPPPAAAAPPLAHQVPAQRTAPEQPAPEARTDAAELPPTAEAPFRPTAEAPRPQTAAAPLPPAAEPDSQPAPRPVADPLLASGPDASPDAVRIRRTMAAVSPVSDKVTSYFYALLFVRHPDLRPLFPPAMDAQRDRLLKALLTAAEHIDNKPVLVDYLQGLGRGHRKYGTRPEHYPAVGECLIEALNKYAESVWDAETEAAWVRAYTTISQVMIDAAAVDELRAPAWWQAEIVAHEQRTADIAVLTVRPDQPYPFRAGQYASVETPWWPRIWRHYSFASAPRSDGLLSFHVKAIPAGWVSNALVHRGRPGDVIRLGPPAGAMTVDHTRDSGLLCLGGGTGIAPIKALVEDVAEHGVRRRMEVFYGARTDHDLYDIDTMLRLKQAHSWLEVRPVVDRDGLLQLPDAIRTFGPWDEYDAYVSGPPGMIRSGVDALRGVGFPKNRIRHDSLDELVTPG